MFRRFLACLLLCPIAAGAQTITGGAAPVLVFTANGSCCGGATTETNISSIRIPGGSLGTNGAIDLKCLWTYPNSANLKTLTVRYTNTAGSISGGVITGALTATTTVQNQTEIVIRNTAANAQVSFSAVPTTPFGASASAATTLALDTTQDTFLNLNGITASGAETITLQQCVALVMRAP